MTARFTDAQVRRYSRQILLPSVGGHGQARLLAAEVTIDVDGAGGRIAALLLAAAGVGRIMLCGPLDRVVGDREVGVPLAAVDRGRRLGEAMAAQLRARNPDVEVVEVAIAPAGALRLDDGGSLAEAFERAGAAATAIARAIASGHGGHR